MSPAAAGAGDSRYVGSDGFGHVTREQAPPRLPLLDVAISGISAAGKEIEDIRSTVAGFVGRTLGPEPEPGNIAHGGRGAVSREPSCRAEHLENELEALHAGIRDLRDQVNRLARV